MLRDNGAAVEYLADRLVELGESVPREVTGCKLDPARNPLADPALTDYANYPPEIFVAPGTKAPNRKGLASRGAWINASRQQHYGPPRFLSTAAELAASTN